MVIDRASIARVEAGLGASWHTVNDAVLAAGRALLIDDPARLDGVKVLGVDEHCWRHPRAGQGTVQRFVTLVIDLTPVRDRTGPARRLDIAEGRSKLVFTTWLAAQTPAFRAGIETVAMDGFTGFKTAAGNGSSNNCTATAAVPMTRSTASAASCAPAPLTELITLGRTLKRRAADVLAYFDRPGSSNGPAEAINGRLKHLRGTALGFRNLGNYTTRALLDTGGFRPRLHPLLR